MATQDSKHGDKDKHADKGKHGAPSGGKHADTGEHAKKNRTERAHVADEGLGMSKYESTNKT